MMRGLAAVVYHQWMRRGGGLRAAAAFSIAAILFGAQALLRTGDGRTQQHSTEYSRASAGAKRALSTAAVLDVLPLETAHEHGGKGSPGPQASTVARVDTTAPSTTTALPLWLRYELAERFDNAMPYFDEERAAHCLHNLQKAVPAPAAEIGMIAIDAKTSSCLASRRAVPPTPEHSWKNKGRGASAAAAKKLHFARMGVADDSYSTVLEIMENANDIALLAADQNNFHVHLPSINVDMLVTRIIQPKENGSDYWLYPEVTIPGLERPTLAVLRPALSQIFPSGDGGLYAPLDGAQYAWQLARGRYISCNRTLAAEFQRFEWSEDLKNSSRDAYYRPDAQWIEGTAHLRDIMYELKVPVMLAMGTLLGWYRNCDWIPYTTDVDLAFFGDAFTPEIERALRDDNDFWLRHIFGLPWEGYEITIMYRRSHNTDLFAFYNEGNMTWVGSTNNAQPADLPRYRWYFPRMDSSLCAGVLHSRLFFVPCDVQPFLAAMYGSGWRRPDDNHGVGGAYRNNGYWPNATRHLTERKHYIVCWNGGIEKDGSASGDACDCPPGYTGRHCTMRVPALHEELHRRRAEEQQQQQVAAAARAMADVHAANQRQLRARMDGERAATGAGANTPLSMLAAVDNAVRAPGS